MFVKWLITVCLVFAFGELLNLLLQAIEKSRERRRSNVGKKQRD